MFMVNSHLMCFLHMFVILKDAEIIRTRDPAELAKCDLVVDVGGEFDAKRHRYDHHQRLVYRGKYGVTFRPNIIVFSLVGFVGQMPDN